MNLRLLAQVAAGAAIVGVGCAAPFDPGISVTVDEKVSIAPDYSGITVPPNCAPLNFVVATRGSGYAVTVQGVHGTPLRVASSNSRIVFPLRPWKNLLAGNAGTDIHLIVSVRDRALGWRTFRPLVIGVAREPIDPYLACRIIKPIFRPWKRVGIYQRNLETSEIREVVHGRNLGNGCVNCHCFLNNSPDRFFVSTRSPRYGSAAILVEDGQATKLDTKFGYTAWHPSGTMVTYSKMQVRQFFHTARTEIRDVIDLASSILYYSVDKNLVREVPGVAASGTLETYPAWASDGETLYFCSAPVLWDTPDKVPPDDYAKVKYSLWKISYNTDIDTWGVPDTVLSSAKTNMSVLLPRVSPNGKFLLFCMCDYGVFPAFQKSSDLYLMDLSTGNYRRLDINSPESESWHCWSSNSRWIAFSSKREDGEFTRTYLSYIDENGDARKPFVVPRKDPAFDASFLQTYSVPEFITGPVRLRGRVIGAAARSDSPKSVSYEQPSMSTAAPSSANAAPEQ